MLAMARSAAADRQQQNPGPESACQGKPIWPYHAVRLGKFCNFSTRAGQRSGGASFEAVVECAKMACFNRFLGMFERAKNFCEFFATMRLTVRWEGSYNPDH
jgi:hypothetical protein